MFFLQKIEVMRNNRASEDIIDAQNRERQERLASKTSYLKSIAFDIESEAKDHNRLLDNVGDDFDSTGNFLSGSLNRVQHMIGSGRNNRKLQCYVVLATIFFIFFIYILSSKLTSSSSWTTPENYSSKSVIFQLALTTAIEYIWSIDSKLIIGQFNQFETKESLF